MSNKLARVKRRSHLERLAKLMLDPEGREYVYSFLAACNIYSTSFGTNALMMAFREGERNAGLRFVADLVEAAPDRYLDMLKECGNVRYTAAAPDESDGDAGNGNED